MASAIDQIEDAAGVGMDEGELQASLKSYIDDAVNYADSFLATQRREATRYYRGDKFGTEEDGRSQVVMTTLRDTVQQAMPSLMRVFAGSERVVEYVPRGEEDVPMAEQATDYANYVFMQDNPGYQILWCAFKDALTKKVGIVKAYYDDSVEVQTFNFTKLNLLAVQELQNDPDLEIVALDGDEMGFEFDVEVRRSTKKDKIRVEVLPPEEFLISRDARSMDDAIFVAHRSMRTPSQLIAMGYPEDLVRKHITKNDDLTWNRERYERNKYELSDAGGSRDRERVLYIESYVYADYDGDGIDELRRVCCMGDGHEVVANDPWDIRPFADFHMDPEPHTFFGHDLFDRTKDLQRVNSEIMRSLLDSLAQSVNPRMAVVDGQVNLEDALNNETGGVIRMQAPGMVQPFAQPFVGKEAMPVLDMFDRIKEQRTGISAQSSGLDAGALQSMTASAVAAIERGSKLTLEVIARNLAETGFKRLMKILLHLIVQHQDAQRMVRLRNEWVPVNPQSWDAQMDVCINVALGSGLEDQKLAVLRETLQAQVAAMQMLGPSNPLVGLGQVRHTQAKILELSGFQDVSRFWNPLPLDFQMPPDDTPSMEELLAQAQREAIMAEIQMKREDLALKAQMEALKDDRERDKTALEFALKAAELNVDWEKLEIDKARKATSAN